MPSLMVDGSLTNNQQVALTSPFTFKIAITSVCCKYKYMNSLNGIKICIETQVMGTCVCVGIKCIVCNIVIELLYKVRMLGINWRVEGRHIKQDMAMLNG